MNQSWRERNKGHVKAYEKKYRENNKEEVLKRNRDWRDRNREHIAKYNKEKYWSDPESRRERAIKDYWDNVEENRKKARVYASLPESKERRKKTFEEFIKNNPDYYAEHYRQNSERYREYQARRRQLKYTSSKNLTEEQIQQMKDIYWLARDITAITGEPYEVDHIVPIKGKNVCGLHVPWNLQILPKDLNRAKGNKYNADEVLANPGVGIPDGGRKSGPLSIHP